jgi:hypothetical protein
MTKQMPEGKMAENEQYQKLLERLAGNQALKRFLARRESDPGIKSPLISPLTIYKGADNPSLFQKEFDAAASDVRTLLTIASQFKRDGMSLAAEALIYTLEHGLPLPGEVEPITDLTTLTFVLPEAAKALLLLRFVMYQSWEKWKREFAEEVFATFATLDYYEPARCPLSSLPKKSSDQFSEELRIKIDGLIGKYMAQEHQNPDGANWSVPAKMIELSLAEIQKPYQEELRGFSPVGNPGCGYYDLNLRYFGQFNETSFLYVKEGHLKEVRQSLSRKFQDQAAFWTIQIPTYQWKYVLGAGQNPQLRPTHRWLPGHESWATHMHLVLFPTLGKQENFSCGWSSSGETFGYGLWFGPIDYWQLKGKWYSNKNGIIFEKDGYYQNSGPLVLDTILKHREFPAK